jgi:3-oxoacyl-(acyl-carrier-protein) synthase/3-hydroxymyristoyl/3-hydroxydecanoyl-(acyl carrier protein) dehydratase
MDIAVVGMDCLLPGAPSAEEWIRLSKAGETALSEVPEGRWPIAPKDVLADKVGVPDKSASLIGGFVTDEKHDLSHHPELPFDELDPLFTWAVRVGEGAIREVVLPKERTGLFIGSLALPTTGAVRANALKLGLQEQGLDVPWLEGGNPQDLGQSGRLPALTAAALGIGGEAIAIDAACASSLYAVELACRQLRSGALDAAVAMGINRADSSYLFIGFSQLHALSTRGLPQPLSAEADGLVVGEGAAAVTLKRLDDALRDGDTIHGLIRGGSLGNDGRSGNLLAPNTEGQLRCLRQAYARTDLSVSSLAYIECHATGTQVGDRSEVAALTALLADAAAPPAKPIVLSSAKSQIGHTVTAAGLAGLIRAIGAVRDGFLPPTPITSPMAQITSNPHLRVLAAAEEWSTPLRRAGVSAFGFGGTNAHLIVENFRADELNQQTPPVAHATDPVAIVAVGAQVGPCDSFNALAEAIRNGDELMETPSANLSRGLGSAAKGAYVEQVTVPLSRYRIPPVELKAILPQQLALLNATNEALAAISPLDDDTTANVIGMEVDQHVSEYVLRWALREAAPELSERLAPALDTAHVQGSLPNFVANRLSAQYGLQGPSYAISAGRLSGLAALQQGALLLRDPNLSAVIVGATDMPGHFSQSVDSTAPLAEGAGVLVIKRLRDAEQSGDPILALVEDLQLGARAPYGTDVYPTHRALLGNAASFDSFAGLLYALAAGELGVTQKLNATGDYTQHASCSLRPLKEIPLTSGSEDGPALTVPHSRGLLRTSSPWRGKWGDETVPVPTPRRQDAPVVANFKGEAKPALIPLTLSRWIGEAPKTPPALRPQTSRKTPPLSPQHVPVPVPTLPLSSPSPTRSSPRANQATRPAHSLSAGHLSSLVDLGDEMARSHEAAVRAHGTFMEQEQRFQDQLGAVGQTLSSLVSLLQSGELRAELRAEQLPPLPIHSVAAPAAPLPIAPRSKHLPTVQVPLEPAPCLYDQAALLKHAEGDLSEVFGPGYADLDQFEPRVRMPMPPLLLCSRVTQISGERGELGASSLTTEYDIPQDAWWSHDGKAPPCVIVESGQADLFLVSYLGVDALCQGERLYRLLDCDLTFHDERPRLGETLRHSIRIKRFARLGGTILFYFEYDCIATSDNRPILTMRDGCAGFFTPAELASPQGLKLPEQRRDPQRLAPLIPGAPSSLDEDAVLALTRSEYAKAFGPAFASADGSPLRLPPTEYRMIHRIRDLRYDQGAYGQGGLIAEQDLRDDDWFNACHFKGDPCMPGTLMFDGCNQALQTWLMGAGWASEYPDEATFEPIPEVTTKLRCRGQIVPGHSLASYEVRVKDLGESPHPWVIADVILSVDGSPVVFAEDVSARIIGARVPRQKALPQQVDTPAIFEFSIGVPSLAFGEGFRAYDSGSERVARMPGPPLLLLDRAHSIQGPQLEMAADRAVSIDYTVPANAWYFDSDPNSAMPFVILLEAALQPCGWLTAWQGANITKGRNTYFRNLGGKATYHQDVTRETGTLTTRATQTSVSNAAGMSLHFFDFAVRAGDQLIVEGNTYFGYFTDEALADQKGLPLAPDELARREALRSEYAVSPFPLANSTVLPRDDLRMLDRVTVYGADQGSEGLGYYEAEKDVDPAEWFFKAHFYEDPVMPGSLGLEALLQLARWVLNERVGPLNGTIQPMLDQREIEWVYRGQVTQDRRKVTVAIDVLAIEDGPEPSIRCNGVLFADGVPLYSLDNFGLAVIADKPSLPNMPPQRPEPAAALLDSFTVDGEIGHGHLRLDPALHPWLDDHRPTLTATALPMAFAAEIAAEAATQLCPDRQVIGLPTLKASSWIHTVDGPVDLLIVAVKQGDCIAVTLSIHHENKRFPQLSGPKVHMEAVVQLGDDYPEAPDGPGPLSQGRPVSLSANDYYTGGHTFHGPSLQGMVELGSRSLAGASSTFRTKPDQRLLGSAAHPFVLDPLLLDTATHPMMSATPEVWSSEIPKGKLAYPVSCDDMTFYGPRPTGEVRCELRALESTPQQIGFEVWLFGSQGLWARFNWVEALVEAGPLLSISPEDRVNSYITRQSYLAPALGEPTPEGWLVRSASIVDPLPRTTADLLCSPAELAERSLVDDTLRWDTRRIAAKECLERQLRKPLGRRLHLADIELLELSHDRFIARHLAGISAQDFIDLAGPTQLHIRTRSTEEGAIAVLVNGPCRPETPL